MISLMKRTVLFSKLPNPKNFGFLSE